MWKIWTKSESFISTKSTPTWFAFALKWNFFTLKLAGCFLINSLKHCGSRMLFSLIFMVGMLRSDWINVAREIMKEPLNQKNRNHFLVHWKWPCENKSLGSALNVEQLKNFSIHPNGTHERADRTNIPNAFKRFISSVVRSLVFIHFFLFLLFFVQFFSFIPFFRLVIHKR